VESIECIARLRRHRFSLLWRRRRRWPPPPRRGSETATKRVRVNKQQIVTARPVPVPHYWTEATTVGGLFDVAAHTQGLLHSPPLFSVCVTLLVSSRSFVLVCIRKKMSRFPLNLDSSALYIPSPPLPHYACV
jgi:hypothetical protein